MLASFPTTTKPDKMGSLNLSNPAIKRIMKEFQQFQAEPSSDFVAFPIEDNLFEWHFTIKGPPDSEFANGLYHGRILLPDRYPFAPPDIMILTPNGRFETNTKICLSVTGFHPKSWQPAWGIRTVLIALSAFFPTEANGAVGSLDLPKSDRLRLAVKSRSWKCELCQKCNSEWFASSCSTTSEAALRVSNSHLTPIPTFSPPLENDRDAAQDAKDSPAVRHRPVAPVQISQADTAQPHLRAVFHRATSRPHERVVSVLTLVISFIILWLLFRKLTRPTPNSLAYSFST